MNSVFKNPSTQRDVNPFETRPDMGTSALLEKIAREREEKQIETERQEQPLRHEFTLFTKANHKESEVPQQIEVLLGQLAQEMESIKQASAELAAKTHEVQKEVMQAAQKTNKSDQGIYHLLTLENMLKFLKDARKGINNAVTWLEASVTRQSGRGYKNLSHTKGTSFSQAEELKHARQGM